MKINDKINDIEQSKNDIIYFVKTIMQIDLKPHEELLLKNLVEAKKTGKDLVFLPYKIQPSSNNNTNHVADGYHTEYVIIDDPGNK
jgi:hypothetical protein